jgi:hypothetical protein
MKLVTDDDFEAVEECFSQQSENVGCGKIQKTSTQKGTEKLGKSFSPTINISNCTKLLTHNPLYTHKYLCGLGQVTNKKLSYCLLTAIKTLS